MKKMLIWDKYDNCYKKVIDVEELRKYIEDLTIEIKDKKTDDDFITKSRAKLNIIFVLERILKDLEVEDE